VSRVFIDTSAAYALLVASDANHEKASKTFRRLADQKAALTTTSYVLLETYALIGRRMGLAAVKSFRENMQPLLEVIWVNQRLHEKGLDFLLERGMESLSLVDAVSFQAIRDRNIDEVFAFDRHFAQEGLDLAG
jgi:predicted nucleic acid-binding protein